MNRRELDLTSPNETEKFEQFLVEMDDVLKGFLYQASAAGFSLDYSLESLDILEAFYLRVKRDEAEREKFIQRAARYLGETVRRRYGGKWCLEIDNPKHLFYGLPILTGHAPSTVKLCPHQIFRMFTKGKPAGFLRQVVASQVDPVPLQITPEE